MRILLTGATGYIAKKLLPVLLADGHEVICVVRDRRRFDLKGYATHKVSVVEADFLDEKSLASIPDDIDAAYYLIHSMSASINTFEMMETESAINFRVRISRTKAKQVIYLSGIINHHKLSPHLASRKAVEEILKRGSYQLTTLRAGIIVGEGSASFEIIRDLVEKLPVMITPKWLNTRTQPIAVQNVIQFLRGVLLKEDTFGNSFDIGGPDILTYKQMLLQYAEVRNLKRYIGVVPVMTPKLSSYWLYFITSTSYKLAVNLVHSMKIEVICTPNDLARQCNVNLLTYREAVQQAFEVIGRQGVLSSWTDARSGDALEPGIDVLLSVPTHGVLRDQRIRHISDEEVVFQKIWKIGGKTGWYYGNWLWSIRGFLDKLAGGVGLRRGRKSAADLKAGDALDFWRVLLADKAHHRLLLYAEMKLPGDAWLEFVIKDQTLYQTATFRPLGIWGRLYWYTLWPLHFFVFRGMINRIVREKV